jgi:transposase-like protein
MYCTVCQYKYTPNPKNRAHSGEVRAQALRLLALGNTGRGVGKVFKMSNTNVYRWAAKEPLLFQEFGDNEGGIDLVYQRL